MVGARCSHIADSPCYGHVCNLDVDGGSPVFAGTLRRTMLAAHQIDLRCVASHLDPLNKTYDLPEDLWVAVVVP